ncbi:MAG: chemotaxis protein CheW [Spirulinaceae cyanobacterium SM2_1_0]|nr:chemotaxis protein CheW [Spirulinaceae cyanobacterium SM2_1_0]
MSPRLPDTIRAIAFQTAGYRFALPMRAVVKVSHCPPPADADRSFDAAGLLRLGGEAIALLDLNARLEVAEPEDAAGRSPFLILARAPHGELYGLQIDELPNMLDLASASIQPLPIAARRSPLRRVAKYAALWQTPEQDTLIFLLDLELATQALSSR